MDFPMPVSDQPRASSAEILSAHVSMPGILWHPIGKCQRYPIMLFHNTTQMTVGGGAIVASGNAAFFAPMYFPSKSATIQFRADKQGPQDFDAAIVTASVRAKYGLK